MAKPKKSATGSIEIGSMERKVEFKQRKFKLSEKQVQLLDICLNPETKIVFIAGPAGSAKAQPLSEPILTPNGWVEMGDIKKGDFVMAPNGESTEVLDVFPQGKKEIFKVRFTDGSFTYCCDDHLWLTQTNDERYNRKKVKGKRFKDAKPGRVRSLKEIRETLYKANSTRLNHFIPITKPVNFVAQEHVIHPYVLGALIGDGGLTIKTSFTTADEEMVRLIQMFLPKDHSIHAVKQKYEYSIVGKDRKNLIWEEIKKFGLNVKSDLKFIPKNYLIDSVENRILLLQGLMDTDGTCDSRQGKATFSTSSQRLAFDVKELIESLGGIGRISSSIPKYTHLGKKQTGKVAYKINLSLPPYIQPFCLSRKIEKYRPLVKYFPARAIESAELAGEEECQCILVKDESHLYLTRDYIVTHNTYLGAYSALNLMAANKELELIYIRSIAESADKSLGSLPGTAEEKFAPFLIPLEDKLDEIITAPTMVSLRKDGAISTLPINFVRGSSWQSKIILADEIQNLSKREITTLITRIGENTKIFFLGDLMQSDIRQSGFSQFMEAFDNEESRAKGIHVFKFDKSDIFRSEILKFIVEKIENMDKKV